MTIVADDIAAISSYNGGIVVETSPMRNRKLCSGPCDGGRDNFAIALACFMRERANQGMPVSCFGEDE